VPRGDVAHVDDVERAVDVHGDLAQQEAAHQLVRGAAPAGVIRPEHERRVDDHHVEAPLGVAQRLLLRLVLGVDVGVAEPPARERLGLVGGAAPGHGADCAHRRRVDDPMHPGAPRLLEHVAGPGDVDLEHPLAVAVAHRGDPRDVEHPVHAIHRPPHRVAVDDVADRRLVVDPRQVLEPGGLPGQQAQLITAVRERPDDVRAEKARAAGDERLAHAAGW